MSYSQQKKTPKICDENEYPTKNGWNWPSSLLINSLQKEKIPIPIIFDILIYQNRKLTTLWGSPS